MGHRFFGNCLMLLWKEAEQDALGIAVGHGLGHIRGFIDVQSTLEKQII